MSCSDPFMPPLVDYSSGRIATAVRESAQQFILERLDDCSPDELHTFLSQQQIAYLATTLLKVGMNGHRFLHLDDGTVCSFIRSNGFRMLDAIGLISTLRHYRSRFPSGTFPRQLMSSPMLVIPDGDRQFEMPPFPDIKRAAKDSDIRLWDVVITLDQEEIIHKQLLNMKPKELHAFLKSFPVIRDLAPFLLERQLSGRQLVAFFEHVSPLPASVHDLLRGVDECQADLGLRFIQVCKEIINEGRPLSTAGSTSSPTTASSAAVTSNSKSIVTRNSPTPSITTNPSQDTAHKQSTSTPLTAMIPLTSNGGTSTSPASESPSQLRSDPVEVPSSSPQHLPSVYVMKTAIERIPRATPQQLALMMIGLDCEHLAPLIQRLNLSGRQLIKLTPKDVLALLQRANAVTDGNMLCFMSLIKLHYTMCEIVSGKVPLSSLNLSNHDSASFGDLCRSERFHPFNDLMVWALALVPLATSEQLSLLMDCIKDLRVFLPLIKKHRVSGGQFLSSTTKEIDSLVEKDPTLKPIRGRLTCFKGFINFAVRVTSRCELATKEREEQVAASNSSVSPPSQKTKEIVTNSSAGDTSSTRTSAHHLTPPTDTSSTAASLSFTPSTAQIVLVPTISNNSMNIFSPFDPNVLLGTCHPSSASPLHPSFRLNQISDLAVPCEDDLEPTTSNTRLINSSSLSWEELRVEYDQHLRHYERMQNTPKEFERVDQPKSTARYPFIPFLIKQLHSDQPKLLLKILKRFNFIHDLIHLDWILTRPSYSHLVEPPIKRIVNILNDSTHIHLRMECVTSLMLICRPCNPGCLCVAVESGIIPALIKFLQTSDLGVDLVQAKRLTHSLGFRDAILQAGVVRALIECQLDPRSIRITMLRFILVLVRHPFPVSFKYTRAQPLVVVLGKLLSIHQGPIIQECLSALMSILFNAHRSLTPSNFSNLLQVCVDQQIVTRLFNYLKPHHQQIPLSIQLDLLLPLLTYFRYGTSTVRSFVFTEAMVRRVGELVSSCGDFGCISLFNCDLFSLIEELAMANRASIQAKILVLCGFLGLCQMKSRKYLEAYFSSAITPNTIKLCLQLLNRPSWVNMLPILMHAVRSGFLIPNSSEFISFIQTMRDTLSTLQSDQDKQLTNEFIQVLKEFDTNNKGTATTRAIKTT